jgi:hypothetical protein
MSKIIDLISDDFSLNIERMFSSNTNRNKLAVLIITRAYYVYVDLKAGIQFSEIEFNRLVAFKNFIQSYLSMYDNDDSTKVLYSELCIFLELE